MKASALGLLFLFLSNHATATPLSFGYVSQSPIQIEENAWLVKRPAYAVGEKTYWVGSYTLNEEYDSTDLNNIDTIICKRLGFEGVRPNTRQEIQPGLLRMPFSFVLVNENGSVIQFEENSTSVYAFITFWDELICER